MYYELLFPHIIGVALTLSYALAYLLVSFYDMATCVDCATF
jgi:hypothetical protein